MAERTKQEQAVVTNLMDAGCDNELIDQFMDLLKNGKKEAGLSLLAKHRSFLLDCYHADQKRIDCLDCVNGKRRCEYESLIAERQHPKK